MLAQQECSLLLPIRSFLGLMSLLWLVLLPLSPSLPGWSPLLLHSLSLYLSSRWPGWLAAPPLPSSSPGVNMLADPSPSSPLALGNKEGGGAEVGRERGVADSWCVNILAPIFSPLG